MRLSTWCVRWIGSCNVALAPVMSAPCHRSAHKTSSGLSDRAILMHIAQLRVSAASAKVNRSTVVLISPFTARVGSE
ncbi:hypothetical protein BC827DRAFT_1235976 [Russula dissimulans]|nr:hypothetical protein BC827DRAFT_1235976 [Russula dissimulans]